MCFNIRNVRHFNMNKLSLDFGSQDTFNGHKTALARHHAELAGKLYRTTTAIAAQTGQMSVSIVVDHLKVRLIVITYEDQPVCPDAEFSVTEVGNQRMIVWIKCFISVVNHDKVVARALIFVKIYGLHVVCVVQNYELIDNKKANPIRLASLYFIGGAITSAFLLSLQISPDDLSGSRALLFSLYLF